MGPSPSNIETRATTALCISHEMTLVGAGAATTVIDGNQPSGNTGAGNPVMFVGYGATVEIRGLTMEKGNFSEGTSFIGHGGGIRNFGTLTLTECVLGDNFGGRNGGAVYNSGDLRVVRSTLSHNSTLGEGGAIANFLGGLVRVSESVISDNSADNGGGGIFNGSGTVTIVNSTISGNVGTGQGGGLWNHSFNTMSLTNVTVSGNRSQTAGGILNTATMHLQNVTVANNTAQWFTDPTRGVGGGILNSDGSILTVQNTLIAGNFAAGNCSINGCFPAGPDCFAFAGRNAALTSQGYNLIQDTNSCDIAGDTTGNIYG